MSNQPINKIQLRMKSCLFYLSLATIPVILTTTSANAQTPNQKEIAEMAVTHNEALAANRQVMENYSWNYRMEVRQDGVIQWVDLVNIKMGADGLPVFTQVNREQIVDQKSKLFGKKRRQEKGFEEMDREVENAIKWILFYGRLPADRIHTLFRKAAEAGTAQVAPANENLVGVTATNVRDSDAGDQVSLWFNKTNGHPVFFSFSSPAGGEDASIQAEINYRYLQNGEAFYPDHVDASITGKSLQIKLENVNVQKKP
jgi:hypothetical protein